MFRFGWFLLTVLMMSAATLSAQQPVLERDPSGQSGYLVPSGWTVQFEQTPTAAVLRMDERPGVADSPTLMVLSQPATMGTAETMLAYLSGLVTNAQVLDHIPATAGEGYVLLEGTIDGIPAKMAAMSLYDPSQNLIFGALLAAPTSRFEALDGTNLLYAVLERPGPAQYQAPVNDWTGYGSGTFDINSYDTQLQLLNERTPVAPERLIGQWTQGISVPMGSNYEDLITGEVSYGQLGHGFFLELREDGSYDLIYNYSHTYMGCKNSVKAYEHGRFAFDGATLTLQPAAYEGTLNTCGSPPTPTQRHRPPTRTYEVGMEASGQYMVIRGTPPRYVVGKLGEEPNRYIREGFTRQ